MPNVFRWNVARRELLGRLVTGEPAELFPLILKEVRRCAARVIAMSGDSRLVFVGRSPEALFDYLAASSGFGRGEGTRGFIGSVLRDYRGYSLVSSGDG